MTNFSGARLLWTYSALLLLSSATQPGYEQTITRVSGGIGGTATTNVAPGGIISIAGSNLAQTTATYGSATGSTLPTALALKSRSEGDRRRSSPPLQRCWWRRFRSMFQQVRKQYR